MAISVDISERKRIQEVERHLALLIGSSNDAILGIDLDMVITSWNAAGERLYGYSEAEALGQSVLMLVPDDRKDEEPTILRQIRAGLFVEPYETKRRRKNGQLVDVLLSVSPILDGSGHVIGASKVANDISARKEAERLKAVLAEELNHRVKNLLATVMAVARQTLGRGDPSRQDVEAFNARLASLGRAQDLLVHEAWEHAELGALVREAVSPYPAEKFTISGPSVALPPKAVVSLSLAVYELATNAAKYGSLSVPEGSVAITWALDPADRHMLRLQWKETGGPEVTAPSSRGFGSTLIERLLASELKGTSEIQFHPTGVVCVISGNVSVEQTD